MNRLASPNIDGKVFWIALTISVAFVLWGVLGTESLANAASAALGYVISTFGWVFVLASFGFLAFSVMLALSRYGRIRLGGQDERPEFRTVSWVAMMFSAGMGIGLMLYGWRSRSTIWAPRRTAWPRPTPGMPPRWPWNTRTSTGRFTRGPCTPC